MICILIVDDEEGVRRSLKKVLERDGYDILLADSGDEAIRIVREKGEHIETVISDLKMPGLDGLETLLIIGRLNPEITRIMLTGYATVESAIEAVNTGIDGFLTKPFENTELRAKVREYNIKKRLKQFVSEQVLEELHRAGTMLRPKRQQVTIMFSDIRGFSEISERMESAELSEMLNRHYFSPLDNVIFAFNGTLDKHIGDGIMGIFGAPIAYGDDAQRAVLCALSMREAMSKVNEDLLATGRRIAVGIGIGTGEVMAGIFGSSRKKEYTVFGAPVNLAARLEQAALENQILICGDTFNLVRDVIDADKVEPLPLKGFKRRLDVFNVVGLR